MMLGSSSDSENIKLVLSRLSDQVATLCSLVSSLQDSIKHLKINEESDDEDECLCIANSMTLIQPEPIPLYPSQNEDLILSYMTPSSSSPQFQELSSPASAFIMSDLDSPMMGYFEAIMYDQDSEMVLTNNNSTFNSNNKHKQVVKRPSRKSVRKPCGPLKILIVEDDPLCQQLISHIIKSLHIGQFELVADGVEAVINMSTGSFDLILMDMQLPHLDGLQATQNIRKFNRRTPIISMTARVSDEDRRRYFEGGIDEILPKPFDKNSVQKIIEQFFKLSLYSEEDNTSED